MSAKILLVFEGRKTEHHYCKLLRNYLKNSFIDVSFSGPIYDLYNLLTNDGGYKDIFSILKTRKHNKHLQEYNRNSFGEIYLFFDYDSHSTHFNFNQVAELVDFFNNETENGKLFISYPMVESLKDIADINNKDCFIKHTSFCRLGKRYKNHVHKNCDKAVNVSISKKQELITIDDISMWNKIIDFHCSKANYIVTGTPEFPKSQIEQHIILEKQYDFSEKNEKDVYVLNSFPLMLLHYFDCDRLYETITK